MEDLRRIGNDKRAVSDNETGKTTILPINKRPKIRAMRTLFFLFLLTFFGYCFVLMLEQLFTDGRLSSWFFELLLVQEFGMLK